MDSPTVSSRSIDPRAIPVALEVDGAAQSLAVAPPSRYSFVTCDCKLSHAK